MIPIPIQDQLEAQYAKRWVIIHTDKEQSVAEHSYNVALLTRELCRMVEANPGVALEAIEYAMMHDLYEVYTGDIPKNAKSMIEGKTGYKMPDIVAKPSKEIVSLVKICDIIETASFIYFHGRSTLRGQQVCEAMMGSAPKAIKEAAFDDSHYACGMSLFETVLYSPRSWTC